MYAQTLIGNRLNPPKADKTKQYNEKLKQKECPLNEVLVVSKGSPVVHHSRKSIVEKTYG